MQRFLWFISTIPILPGHPLLRAQAVTGKAPYGSVSQPGLPVGRPIGNPAELSTSPDLSTVPLAVPLPTGKTDHIVEDAAINSHHGDIDLLSGDVQILYGRYQIHADSIRLDKSTREVVAEGHLRVTGENGEYIRASHGTFNLGTGTGRFYDVSGSVGLHNRQPATAFTGSRTAVGLQNANPFLFTGRIVDKTGPDSYTIYDGTITTCLLPRPDWLFSSRRLAVSNGKAHASGAIFHVLGLPLLPLPYITAPVDSEQRQSGLLIPVFGDSSTKGVTVGEQVYLTLGRSADLTAGAIYYSLRGFSESSTVRYRGLDQNFLTGHFSALQDRGYTANNGVYVNQGGEDVTAAFRRQLSPNLRAVGDGEYLSSYVYREAFTDSFNQAVSSDITSIGYVTRQTGGWSMDGRVDRYQGLKEVPVGTSAGQEVHILHVPSFDLNGVDRPIAGTPFLWTLDGSAAGLKRAQPNFTSSGITERLDLRPELSLPLHFDGWNVRASFAARETFYSRSRLTPYAANAAPVELAASLNRADVETEVAIRPPVLERTFPVPASLQTLFGTEVRHTIEPEVTYRDVAGVNNFLNVLRFDDVDLVSDTNELEYGVTQHLYFRPPPKANAPVAAGCPSLTSGSSPAARGVAAADPDLSGSGTGADTAGETNSADAGGTAIPDVLMPSAGDSTDANGIPVATADAPDLPTRNHPHRANRCAPPVPAPQQPLLSWRLTQRVFFDPTFGGAVVLHRRNIFDSTLSLSGIAFLTEPRDISPLISRLRVRSSGHTDVEWDFDLDTGAKKFTSSNVFLDAHNGPVFGGVSYARLNAPGRFATEVLDTNQSPSLVSSPVSNFSQLRLLIGYGLPSRPGLSIAANTGLDLLRASVQYAALQTSYNWNCCGLAVEYRKFDLGTVRDENSYRFNFTLANIGTAGNIRRAERLF